MGALGSEIPVSEPAEEYRERGNSITVEERAEWLIDYVILHRDEGRNHLLRRVVEQFIAAEISAYERGRRDAAAGASPPDDRQVFI